MTKSALEATISNTYYKSKSEIERTNKQYMRAMVPSATPLKILDVGCGTGLNAARLAKARHTVIGIDLSPVAIEKYRASGFEGVVCDIELEPAPFQDESFDLVYASEIIEHCANTAAFLDELNRLLKVGGTLLLSTPNSAFWAYRLLELLGLTVSEFQHPGHVRFFSRRSLAKAVQGAGFEVVRMAARHMYVLLGKRIGDPAAPLLRLAGFQQEPRFATGDHFWQLSHFSKSASGWWADTLIVEAKKTKSK